LSEIPVIQDYIKSGPNTYANRRDISLLSRVG